jgi:transposase-like protein
MAPKEPYDEMSLLDFQKRFPDEDRCWEYVVRLRWPKGNPCPGCHRAMGFVATRRLFQCNPCGKQISATAGTVFHKSRIPLQKWFWAIYLMGTTSKGVSMRYLQKHLRIKNYKTMWLLGHKIRQAMVQREELYRLRGTVQVDEVKLGRQNWDDRRKRREERHTKFLMGVQEGMTHDYPRFVTFEQLETAFKEEVLPALEKRIKREPDQIRWSGCFSSGGGKRLPGTRHSLQNGTREGQKTPELDPLVRREPETGVSIDLSRVFTKIP